MAIMPAKMTENGGIEIAALRDRIGIFCFISTSYVITESQRVFETFMYFNDLRRNSVTGAKSRALW
jgi:hypothetical protein